MKHIRMLVPCLAFALLILASTGLAAEMKFTKSATADLDGDGVKEQVSLSISRDRSRHSILHVGRLSTEVREQLPEGLAIVDVDTKDRFKEVIVRCGNPYDGGYFSHIYEYDGKTLKETGVLRSPRFTGRGIIYADDWTCSFLIKRKFILDSKTRKIEEVRQPMYYIGQTFKTDGSFPIRRSVDDASVVASIEAKSHILIVAVAFQQVKKKILNSDKYETIERSWYLIKSHSGLMGWASYEEVAQHVPIPMAG